MDEKITKANRAYQPFGGAKQLIECRDPEVLLCGSAGTGKAQPLTETIMTPRGKVLMGSVSVGDVVSTPDGGGAKVVGVFPQGVQDVYRVRFSCGRVVRCTADHLWSVSRHYGKPLRHQRFVLPTSEIAQTVICARTAKRLRWWVDPPQPIDMVSKSVPIPPYVFGVWIGDGSRVFENRGGLQITSNDPEIIKHISDNLTDGHEIRHQSRMAYRIYSPVRRTPEKHKKPKPNIWFVCGKFRMSLHANGIRRYVGSYLTHQEAMDDYVRQPEYTVEREFFKPYQERIEDLGLYGCMSYQKFIPDVYKYNSIDVRLAVVQGLMDTDGTVDKHQGAPSYCTSSPRLARDFRFLIESLGGGVTIKAKKTKCRVAYICHIRMDDPSKLFRLSRKKILCKPRTKYPFRRWIESITYEGREECQCISIDSQDKLYLTNGFVPTHNSLAAATKIYLCASKYPGMRALIARKTRESLSESTLVTWEQRVVPEGHPILNGSQRRMRQVYTFPNGSEIVVGGMDKPQKIMSTEYDMAMCPEATELNEEDWGAISTRLRNGKMPYQQIIADCNPSYPRHWLKQRCDDGKTTMILSKHEDNPLLFDQKTGQITVFGMNYLAKLDKLPHLQRERLRYGKWVQAEGSVYDEWDERIHVVDDFPIPPEWPRYWGIDWGYLNPLVVHFYAMDNDGRLILFRELYQSHLLVEDAAQVVKQMVNEDLDRCRDIVLGRLNGADADHTTRATLDEIPSMIRPRAIIADHDLEDRRTFERHTNLTTTAANKAVSVGIQVVKERLRVQGDGKPRLIILRGALYNSPDAILADAKKPTCTKDEIEGYVWADSKTKEVPVKENDHGADILKYMSMYHSSRKPFCGSVLVG